MWINIVFFSSISFVRVSYKTIWLKHDLNIKTTEKWNLEGLKSVFSKRCASKIWGEVSEVRLKKLDSFTLETSNNHVIRNYRRNGRLRVKWFRLKFGTSRALESGFGRGILVGHASVWPGQIITELSRRGCTAGHVSWDSPVRCSSLVWIAFLGR